MQMRTASTDAALPMGCRCAQQAPMQRDRWGAADSSVGSVSAPNYTGKRDRWGAADSSVGSVSAPNYTGKRDRWDADAHRKHPCSATDGMQQAAACPAPWKREGTKLHWSARPMGCRCAQQAPMQRDRWDAAGGSVGSVRAQQAPMQRDRWDAAGGSVGSVRAQQAPMQRDRWGSGGSRLRHVHVYGRGKNRGAIKTGKYRMSMDGGLLCFRGAQR